MTRVCVCVYIYVKETEREGTMRAMGAKRSSKTKKKLSVLPPPGSIFMTKYRSQLEKKMLWYCLIVPDEKELEEFSRLHNNNKQVKNTNPRKFLMRYGKWMTRACVCTRTIDMFQCCTHEYGRAYAYVQRTLLAVSHFVCLSCTCAWLQRALLSLSLIVSGSCDKEENMCARFFACVCSASSKALVNCVRM